MSTGRHIQSTIVCDFLTALVYSQDCGELVQGRLSQYAKNMSRVSGCLDAMMHSFNILMVNTFLLIFMTFF